MTTVSSSNENASLPVVVIIGGGFAGLSAAKALADAPELSESALRQLHALHVEVLLNSTVTRLAEGEVDINQQVIKTRTVIWAAGNKASPLAAMPGAEVDRQGRAKVNPDLTIPGHPEIQAVGDMILTTFNSGKPVPGAAVLFQWIWAYFNYGRGAGLITGSVGKWGVLNER